MKPMLGVVKSGALAMVMLILFAAYNAFPSEFFLRVYGYSVEGNSLVVSRNPVYFDHVTASAVIEVTSNSGLECRWPASGNATVVYQYESKGFVTIPIPRDLEPCLRDRPALIRTWRMVWLGPIPLKPSVTEFLIDGYE